MSVLAIISDLHFGTVPAGLTELLLEDISAQKPDAVIVAGDLTQRARRREFVEAAEFLRRLPGELLVLPGNHDIPTFRLLERVLRPFGRYRLHIGATGIQTCGLPDCLVVGINTTARAQPHLKWQEGRLRRANARKACQLLQQAPPGSRRIIVTHHPLVPVADMRRAVPARRAKSAVRLFAEAGVELLVSGHTHLPFRFNVPIEAPNGGRQLVAIGTPSALSSRLRGEPNGYWLVSVPGTGDAPIRTELRGYDGSTFAAAALPAADLDPITQSP